MPIAQRQKKMRLEQSMKIDQLVVKNFKKFADQTFTFHPQFTLLVGENGSGKTSVLDALAVALGIWLVEPPDSSLQNSRRNILTREIRIESLLAGDRIQFLQQRPVEVTATGRIGEKDNLTWTRRFSTEGKKPRIADAKEALAVVAEIYGRVAKGQHVLCPVLAYYGAGRAWLPSNKLTKKEANGGPARRWAAFYDCFTERIRFDELRKWFHRETTAAGNRGGRMRPGFEVVKQAVLGCVPDADNVWYDDDQGDIILSIAGQAQPFNNLSAGQRMMLALVADIASKAVTQNAYLLPPDELGPEDKPLPRLLQETPGVVLIDELDVHLHPKWQRHVVEDLRTTFPKIQFIGTTHSPFVIQSLRSGEELILLDGQSPAQVADMPIDEIAQGIMGVSNPQVSIRYEEMNNVARHYLETLEEAALAPEEKLVAYKERLAQAIAPYADNPAFQAFLEMKRAAKLGE
ncbi:MAG: AAA family ATPase [Acidobacteriota bacterium]|nr:AAA family ATPase [Acidobacteriota bacterium]